MEVVFNYTRYEGGHPMLGDKGGPGSIGGNLHVGTAGIGMGTFKIKNMIPMSLVESIEVVSANVAKSKVGAVAAFGVLGLAAKGSKQQTGLIVHTYDGNAAYFTIDKMSEIQVRAKLAPVLAASFKPFTGAPDPLFGDVAPTDPVVTEATSDVVSQLRELAQMRNDGLLTQEEFAAAKAQLLREPVASPAVGFADERSRRLADEIRQSEAERLKTEQQRLEAVSFHERDIPPGVIPPKTKTDPNAWSMLLKAHDTLARSAAAIRASQLAEVESLRELGSLTEDEYTAMMALFEPIGD